MPSFHNTKIYKIACIDETITEFYIGSTIQSISKRFALHKSACNNPQDLRRLYVFIREHGGIDNWNIIKLEDYPCNTDSEKRLRERLYYEILEPTLNSERPYLFITERQIENIEYQRIIHSDPILYNTHLEKMKKYYTLNADQIKSKSLIYYHQNKDKRNEYGKQYRLKNQEEIRQRDRLRYKLRKEKINPPPPHHPI
jgi:hypothetical protein